MIRTREVKSRVIELKINPKFFVPVATERKQFEIRKNDRDYMIGDTLMLREYSNKEYTGRMVAAVVTYITDYAQRDGYVVLGIIKVYRPEAWFKAVMK
jgi:hypothetical protein